MIARMARLACLCLLFALAEIGAARAQAARSRVTLVRTPSNDPLLNEASTRLRAELAGAGFDVVEIERAPGASRIEVEGTGDRSGSIATIAIDRAGAGAMADVWISDRVSGKTVVRRLRVGGGPRAATVLAIRALELLRASLLEVVLRQPAEEKQPAKAPTDVVKWVEPTLPEPAVEEGELFDGVSLGAGVQALHGLDGIGLAIGPTLRAFHGIASHGFGRLVLAGPLGNTTLSEPEGSAAVRQEFLSLDLGWATPAAPLGALAWIGAGGYHLHTTGTAVPPYNSTSDDVLALLLTAGVGGVARLSRGLAVTAEAGAAGIFPRPIVVIAGRDAGSTGAPSLSFAFNLLVAL
jgi:hypothetical protein